MGLHQERTGKRDIQEMNVLVARTGKYESEELHFLRSPRSGAHVVESEIGLPLKAVRELFNGHVLSPGFLPGDVVFFPDVPDKVEYSPLTHFWEIDMVFFEPIVKLGGRCIWIQRKLVP